MDTSKGGVHRVPFRVLTRDERELILTKTAGEPTYSVYTSDPVEYRRLLRKGWVPTRLDDSGAYFDLPKEALTIRSRKAVEGSKGRGNPSSLKRSRQTQGSEGKP